MLDKLKLPPNEYTAKCKYCKRIFSYSNEKILLNNLNTHEGSCKGERNDTRKT
jgi:hypothetical protein